MSSLEKLLVAVAATFLYAAFLVIFPIGLIWLSHTDRELAIFAIKSIIFSLFIIPLFKLVPEFIDAISEVCSLLFCSGEVC